MSFGNFIFFAAHFLCLLGVSRKEDPRRHLHTGLLPLQLIVWFGTLFAMFAVPSYVFDTYGQVCRLSRACSINVPCKCLRSSDAGACCPTSNVGYVSAVDC